MRVPSPRPLLGKSLRDGRAGGPWLVCARFSSDEATAVPPYETIGTDALLMYLSFVTITTTGYGDITPVSPPARVLCVLEAIVGQLFLTITVARLVGLYTASGGLPVKRDRS